MLKKLLFLNEKSGKINLDLIIDYAKQGVSNQNPQIRYYLWQLLLFLLPSDRSQWDHTLELQVETYRKWVEIHMNEISNWLERTFPQDVIVKDFGLSHDEYMFQIHGDLSRTPYSVFYFYKLANSPETVIEITRRIERILYIFSCLNPTYSYTQGFNELVTPIYFVVNEAHKILGYNSFETEAITYYLLQNLITSTGIGDIFSMDRDFQAVNRHFNTIIDMLKICDFELYKSLFEDNEIVPLHFAFSWVSVLFNQLYQGESLLLLWDRFLLRKDNLIQYAMAIATSHLILVRSNIIGKNFQEILELLHNIKDLDPPTVVAIAEDVYIRFLSQK